MKVYESAQRREPPFGNESNHVEVEPPHRRRHHHSERRGDDDARRQLLACSTHAQRDDGLAERDDDDQSVSLGEVRGVDVPATRAGNEK